MSQTVAFVLPLPVALALAVLLLGLLGLSALALSLRKPAPVRLPAGDGGRSGHPAAGDADADWLQAAQSHPG